MSARSTRPNAPDHAQVVEVVTLAAYERLRVDLAIAHGTELVSWDEQNPKMRVDLRETVEPTVSDTLGRSVASWSVPARPSRPSSGCHRAPFGRSSGSSQRSSVRRLSDTQSAPAG